MTTVESLSYSVRPQIVGHYLGQLVFLVGILSIPPLLFSLIEREFLHAGGYMLAVAAQLGAGFFLQRHCRAGEVQLNEAIVVVVSIFILTAFALAVPLMVSGLHFADALFETVSGITTTGLSTLATVEDQPPSLLFTASWLQWIGGIGILVLSFPLLFGQGASARKLNSVLGAQEGLLGGTRAYATITIRIYVMLTLIGIFTLWIAGADFFAATTLALSSVSTGGYSPFNASLGGLSELIQTLVMVLCIAGAVAIPLFYEGGRGNWRSVVRDPELHTLLIACLIVSTLLVARHWATTGVPDGRAMDLVLTAISAQSTAGFSATPVSELDSFSKVVLIISMAIGGSVGSSAGGIKLLRLILFIKLVRLLIVKTRASPHAETSLHISGRNLTDSELVQALSIIGLFCGVIFLSWLPFLWYGYDPLNALFEVVSATGTVGLSTGITGPGLEPMLKGLLCLDMLLGRLEVLALFVFVSPRTWIGPYRSFDESKTQIGN